MIAYILDKTNLKIKDFFYFKDYLFADDIEYSDKSRIVVPKLVNVTDDDFVLCKDGKTELFFGIASDTDTNDQTDNFELTLKQKECLFDRFIFVENDSLIASSVESFIASCINSNWVSSGDSLMDREYIVPVNQTDTQVAASIANIVNVENGVFNLKTFLGNVKERYGIFLNFELADTDPKITTGPRLKVNIYKDDSSIVPVDTDVSDISDCQETYNVDALAKLKVKWFNSMTERVANRTYFLTADRSVTEDISDQDRVDGTIKSVYIEAETEEAMREEVTREFMENTYSHKVTFFLREGSTLYYPEDYYVGRKCTLETKTGVKTSIITAIENRSGVGARKITMGKLKVSLTERLRDKYG